MTFEQLKQAILEHRRQIRGGLVVMLFGGIGFVALASSHAATYASSKEAESGTLSGSQAAGDAVGASGGASVKFGAGQTAGNSSCPLPSYPTPACTGVPAGTSLTDLPVDADSSYTVTQDGTIIDGKHVAGTLVVKAKNVVIKNSLIDAGVYNDFENSKYSFSITDSTVGKSDSY
jgi:hypothetical protein